ncbi:glutathione S-transferase family protein [Xinfangfangia sp. CPCC 101601]|uniref:Glutathione S-transferase family protein n=1 Tax=Pseudogemmobacter lacusdianii TaxID=3069608 RepID=A0ABU0W041_9RHOB|nr:glutathione S-transferase family protein [Xinfangfangia sp. CPCC 101601]MDQ2066805.1 glutathione S-transferase family protein [Xinfangfangia sp. CPCC 101601]
MAVQLYGFGESGNAYKCALALELTGQAWELRFVDFFKGEARSPAFRAINPMAEIPVLIDGAETLSQSGLILQHIAAKTGQLGGTNEAERKEIWRWILWDNHKLSTQIGACRFLMNFLAPEKRPEGVVPFLQNRLKAAYQTLEEHLASRDWIVGQGATIADLSCCSYLYYDEPFGFSRDAYPGIDRWLDRIAMLPGWRPPYDLMPRAFPPS